MGDFKGLEVWRIAHEVTLEVYRITSAFPKCETYGLVQQIRRAAASIEANLAEGCGRKTDGELIRFASIANGSAYELECEMLVARDLGYVSDEQHKATDDKVKRVSMIRGLTASLRKRSLMNSIGK